MKKFINALSILILTTFFLACEKKANVESTEKPAETTETVKIVPQSADSLEQLHSILLQALKTKDKNLYISYCFSQEQESKISETLTDEKKRKYFQREFGFSIHEEVAYFENISKYIDKVGIDLTMIENNLIESIDYNRSSYSPIVLKEVIIPIIQEGIERDIVYVAIQIDNKWYFTSELSL